MKALTTLTWLTIAAATQSAAIQDSWLKGFEGTWVVDGARGPDASIVLTIVRDGTALVLKTNAIFRTRIDVLRRKPN